MITIELTLEQADLIKHKLSCGMISNNVDHVRNCKDLYEKINNKVTCHKIITEEKPLYACPNCYRVSDEKPKEISYYVNKSIIPGCMSPIIATFETLTCCKYCDPTIKHES